MFDEGEGNWPEEAPFRTPVFVRTKEVRRPWERKGHGHAPALCREEAVKEAERLGLLRKSYGLAAPPSRSSSRTRVSIAVRRIASSGLASATR